MKYHDLLNELDELKLPKDAYAITCSGPLAVRGIRKTNDIDIIVAPYLWDELSKRFPVRKENFKSIDIGNIQILGPGSHFIRRDIKPAVVQIREADIINGKRYVKLEDVRKFKKALGRKKDLEDLKLIDNYLGEE